LYNGQEVPKADQKTPPDQNPSPDQKKPQ